MRTIKIPNSSSSWKIIILGFLIFSTLLTACSGLSAKQKTAAENAIKALRKVEAATQVKVSYGQYSQLMIEAQAQDNEALTALPDGELKKEIGLAMEAYKDAQTAWKSSFSQSGYIAKGYASAQGGVDVIQKYSIPVGNSGLLSPEEALPHIWKVAKDHTDRASSLVDK